MLSSPCFKDFFDSRKQVIKASEIALSLFALCKRMASRLQYFKHNWISREEAHLWILQYLGLKTETKLQPGGKSPPNKAIAICQGFLQHYSFGNLYFSSANLKKGLWLSNIIANLSFMQIFIQIVLKLQVVRLSDHFPDLIAYKLTSFLLIECQ